MRVTHSSLYSVATSRLGSLVEDLNEANRVVTTGKKINRLSDNPVGVSKVVALRSGIAGLNQLTENISTARNWLTAAETALDTVADRVDETKELALAMRNDNYTPTDRATAAVQIQETLGQLLDLANTQVSGQYIFSGTKLDTKAYSFDNADDPTMVTYNGNEDIFSLKTGKDATMAVGQSGEDIFGSKTLTVDGTNNKVNFMEDTGGGFVTELTATLPAGDYTRAELATAMENAMTNASTAAGTNVVYDVAYDAATDRFSVGVDAASPVTPTGLRLLWGTGTNADQSIASDIGFDDTNVTDSTGAIGIGSDRSVQWGLFKTFFDLEKALESNDVDGINKSMARLDTLFNDMTDAVAKIGYKGVGLDSKSTVIEDLNLSYKSQKSEIEEADIIEAITTLNAKQTAYKAALASTAKVMELTLLDYI